MSSRFETFRDPLLSLFQSAVSDIAASLDAQRASIGAKGRRYPELSASSVLADLAAAIAQRDLDERAGVTREVRREDNTRELSKIGIARVCAEWSFRYIKAVARGDDAAVTQLRDEFTAGTCDPAWLSTLDQYRSYFDGDGRRKSIPYVRASQIGPRVIAMKANARVAMVADWATGAPPALRLMENTAAHKPDLLIHLGDIYYSGTPTECKNHFLDVINRTLRNGSSSPQVYTLSGNHDMYCGGVGFYELIKQLNPPPSDQLSSFFCLRSTDERWQILAMDTGLHDDNPLGVENTVTFLEDDEVAWHCDRIREFGGRTILLSHHQLFSAFSPIGIKVQTGKRSAINPHLLKAFQEMTASGDIAAWFWGHEHTLSIYNPFAGLARGRCIGNGAIPVSVIDRIYDPLSDLEEAPSIVDGTRLATTSGVYNNGYALLTFEKDTCRADYFQNSDRGESIIFTEDIS